MKKDITDKQKQTLKDFIRLEIALQNSQIKNREFLQKQKEEAGKYTLKSEYEEKLFLVIISIVSINLFILAVAFNL